MVLGVLVGYACHARAQRRGRQEIAGYFGILTDIFLRMIKMIIAPLVFATWSRAWPTWATRAPVGRIGGARWAGSSAPRSVAAAGPADRQPAAARRRARRAAAGRGRQHPTEDRR
jgi:hypothetical protein